MRELDSLKERKFQHDPSLFVRHLEVAGRPIDGAWKLSAHEMSSHGQRRFPCPVRISEFLPLWIGNGLSIEMQVEKESRHEVTYDCLVR
jgi:hypothetical protein